MYVTLKYLPSNLAQINELDAITRNIIDDYGLAEELYPNILISLTEAVSNAIIHGNELIENRDVSISVNKEDEGISIRVSDEGTGFDVKSIPDPTTPTNVVKQGGRGIFIIRDLVERVTFLDSGSTIDMFFKI